MLVAQLNAEDHHTRTNAAIALYELGPAAKSAVPDLLRLLDDEEVVAAWALNAVAQIGDDSKETVRAVTRVLLDEKCSPSLGFNAAVALGKVGEFEPILQVLKGGQTGWAANVFAHIGPRSNEAFPSVAAMLKDSDPAIRCAAVKRACEYGA